MLSIFIQRSVACIVVCSIVFLVAWILRMKQQRVEFGRPAIAVLISVATVFATMCVGGCIHVSGEVGQNGDSRSG